MIEGLALGAFGTIRSVSEEPLLCEILRYVIADEARHVYLALASGVEDLAPEDQLKALVVGVLFRAALWRIARIGVEGDGVYVLQGVWARFERVV